ncbi:MAG: DNA helicase/exodeoxyribonuclease V, gamma subunit [Candidatus Electronema aureum]|uniref:DNA helicase/exodeoxyribonuclease V, gamma subunit n=1 Tax=Candidatus Electronema aureum TaxID=2005002 RepID=A0A521G422_9BACT|nr:MAG: DNA helicase/exodeoxyribonuclease V, gamma subunit [Candidatus Electronema aureum]
MYLYQSNRLENLLTALCAVLAQPVGNPLASEIIVVQNPGMARWLSQQIALRTGICANSSFPLPASFIWSLFAKTLGGLPDLREFNREVLLWRILAKLDSLLELPSMQEINAYLRDDRDGSKAFQLAGRIADLFDQYLVYRHDMVLAWEKGREEHWQAQLWRQLTDSGSTHRAEVLERFLQAADQGVLRTDGLPERICIFGINSLAPAYIEVIGKISHHIDIRVFHFSPCRQVWDDIMPERLIALKRQNWRRRGTADISSYYTSGNPLLASLGGLGREFFKLLMELNPMAEEQDLYQAPPQDNLLGQIQGDILDLRDRGDRSKGETLPLKSGESSIRFHCCHSPMREIQVLHDRLLDLFAADPQLNPADILVMAPDINRYAPAVAGVFSSAGGKLRIPWSIADQSCREEQPVLEGFLGLLTLVTSRCTAPEVAAMLENPIILERFSLTEDEVPLLRKMITAAGIRWGLEQRSGADALHSWETGIDRLLLGCLTGQLDAPWQGIMPISGGLSEGGDWLGNLAEFIRELRRLRRQTSRPLPPVGWGKLFLRVIDRFLDSGTDQHNEGLLLLRQSIADFVEQCKRANFQQPISLAVIRRHFQQLLTAPAGGQAFLAGRVTVCNMVPMRSVPFKVIWLLGMNDGDFPRSQHPPAFDLMAEHRRPGDRSRRDDDRYLFLEALLSARHHFAVSWAGRDLRDNKPRPPSVVVAELRDYISRGWITADDTAAADQLTVEHPLQPFSRRCFDGKNPNTASYRTEWLPASGKPVPVFASRPLPQPEQWARQIDLNQLVRFWKHPVRFFLEQRLGLRTAYLSDVLLPESESFALDQLQNYQLADEILHEIRHGRQADCPLHRRQAAAELPGGCFGHLLHQKMQTEATELLGKVKPLLSQPVEPVELRLTIDGVRLTGRLTSLCRCGRVTFRPASLKAKDILELWIHHIALLLHQPTGVEPQSLHAAKDKTLCFQEVPDPHDQLARLIHLFQQGCCEPLHFYPESSWAWIKGKSAEAAWSSSFRHKGEGDDPAYEIGLRGHAPFDQQFEELAEKIWTVGQMR